jgi:glycosyltransferase involved in cell wall biosynthesis
MTAPLRVMHVITGLATGGAEVMLSRLVAAMDPAEFSSEVISLTTAGPVARAIEERGVQVRALGLDRRRPNPLALVTLTRWIRRARPDVVQTWMHDADLIGGLCARAARRPPVVWGIHQGVFDPAAAGQRRVMWTARACAGLSRLLPARIVCCSETSRRVHGGLGYDDARMVVIPNGFDTGVFKPDARARAEVRRELGLDEDAEVIGHVGRFHPQKDHRTLLAAAGALSALRPRARFVLCGDGVDASNAELARAVEESGARDRVRLLGRRSDAERLMCGFDVMTSSSAFGEAFPLVLGEAMACGVPCVATDVGDSARLVGDAGRVVPRQDPAALAAAWRALLELPGGERRRLGEEARRRIVEHFSLAAIARRYGDLYRSVAHHAA